MPRKRTTKVCATCKKNKRFSSFPLRGGSWSKLPENDSSRYDSRCRKCRQKHWREIHRRKKLPKHHDARTERMIQTRIKSLRYLASRGCHECGKNDPRALLYEHRDNTTRRASISRMIGDGYSWNSEVLQAEIGKCRVICANCYAINNHKQQGFYADPRVQEEMKKLGHSITG